MNSSCWYQRAMASCLWPTIREHQDLLDDVSLTKRLQQRFGQDFCLQLLRQYWDFALPSELVALKLTARTRVWRRIVSLGAVNQPVMLGNTVIPVSTITGSERKLQHLGNTSLGSYLFAQQSIQRSPLEFSLVMHKQRLAIKLKSYLPTSSSPLWARRSQFILKDKPMLVTELFLPSYWSTDEGIS